MLKNNFNSKILFCMCVELRIQRQSDQGNRTYFVGLRFVQVLASVNSFFLPNSHFDGTNHLKLIPTFVQFGQHVRQDFCLSAQVFVKNFDSWNCKLLD